VTFFSKILLAKIVIFLAGGRGQGAEYRGLDGMGKRTDNVGREAKD